MHNIIHLNTNKIKFNNKLLLLIHFTKHNIKDIQSEIFIIEDTSKV